VHVLTRGRALHHHVAIGLLSDELVAIVWIVRRSELAGIVSWRNRAVRALRLFVLWVWLCAWVVRVFWIFRGIRPFWFFRIIRGIRKIRKIW
jgi:hypothetical protein